MNKKLLGSIATVVVVVVIAVAGYFFTQGTRQEKLLIEEVNTISKMDITKQDVNLPIKTTGDYAVVERAIKSYLSEFGEKAKSVSTILSDEKIAKLLSADNYKEDGPEFKATKEFIATTRTNFNENMDRLVSMCKEETIVENIKKENLSSKYEELYKTLMFDDKVKKDLVEAGDQLSESSELVNSMLNTQEEIINFLANNASAWSINSRNQVEFKDAGLLSQYNTLVRKLSK